MKRGFFNSVMLVAVLMLLANSGYSQLSNPVFNWESYEINKDSKLQSMAVHNDSTAVVAGLGKTFRITTNQGKSWNDVGLLNPKYNFNDISIHGNVGYMVSRKTILIKNQAGAEDDVYVNGVLLKTSDGAESWSVINLSSIGEGSNPALNPSLIGCININPYSVLCVDESNAYVFVHWYDIISGAKKTHSALFKTINGGVNWKAVTADLGGLYINTIKQVGSDIYIGGNKTFYKTTSTGETLTDLFPEFSAVAGTNAFINEIRALSENDITIITTSGLYNTTDGGKSFQKVNGSTGGNDFIKIDDKTIMCIGTSSLSKATLNGGASWLSCSPGKTCFEIPGIFNDSIIVLSSAIIYKLSIADFKSGNFKWVTKILGSGSSNLQKMYQFDDKNALLIGDDQIAKKTKDKGLTWTDITLPKLFLNDGNYDFRSVTSYANTGYVTTRKTSIADFSTKEDYYLNGVIYKTTDAWKSWIVLNNKNIGKDTPDDPGKYPLKAGCYGLDHYSIESVDDKILYLNANWFDTITVPKTVTKHSRIFKTTNGGDSWTAISSDFGSAMVVAMKFSGDTGYIAGNNILLKTTDGGKSFTDLISKIPENTAGDLFFSSLTLVGPDKFYVQTSNNKGAYYSADSGMTFSKINGIEGGMDFVVLDDNSFMSLGSSTPNKFTNDGGLSWKSCNLNAEIYASGQVFNNYLYVLGKTNLYRIAITDLDIKTGISDIIASTPVRVMYDNESVEIASENQIIEKYFIYSITGQLVEVGQPASVNFIIQKCKFKSGSYIVVINISGKRFAQKIILK